MSSSVLEHPALRARRPTVNTLEVERQSLPLQDFEFRLLDLPEFKEDSALASLPRNLRTRMQPKRSAGFDYLAVVPLVSGARSPSDSAVTAREEAGPAAGAAREAR